MSRLRPASLLLVVMVIGAGLALAGCSSDAGAVDNGRLLDLQSEGARIIDVRTEGEFGAGRIPGAENVPLMGLSSAAESWSRTEPVVVYCAVGDRSAEAAQILRSMGFERVYDLSAGIAMWDGEVERGAAAAAGDVPPESDVAASGLPVVYEFFTDW